MKHAGEDETGICRPALQRVSHHAARHGDDWLRFLDGTARVACCPRRRGSPPAVQQHSVVTTCSLGSRSSADRITTDCCRLSNQVSHATWRADHCIGMFLLHSRSPAMDGHHPLGDISNTCNRCKWPNREGGSNIQENNLGTILSGIIFIIVWLVLLVIGVTTVYICKLVSRKKKQSLIVRGKPAIRKMPRVQLLTTVSNHQVSATWCTALLNTVFCIQSINRTINYTYIAKAFLSRQYSNISFERFVLLYIWFV